jgi:hypothetical protein
MEESERKFLRQMRFSKERITEIVNALKKCVYRSDAERCYDLFAGGFSWDDETSYGFSSNDGALNIDDLFDLECKLYLRPVFAYRASLAKGEHREELREEWDDLKNRVETWPGFREERIFGEDMKRMLEEAEKEIWGEDYDEATNRD